MRIILSTNSVDVGTGYGAQAALMLPRFFGLGHHCDMFAWYGAQGAVRRGTVERYGTKYSYTIYPHHADGYGNDIVAAHAQNARADLILTLIDAWVLDPQQHGGSKNWACYFPVDSEPIPPRVLEKAAQAAFPIVYSQFGKRMCENAGLEVAYVPHMVDTAHYAPGDQAAARARLGWPEDAFIAVMVAANKGFPARKNFCEQIDGFAELTKRHADALLYLHTTDGEPNTYGGVNLRSYVRRAGLEGRVSFPDQYAVRMGMGTDYLRDVYQGADVLLSVSAGEGFGVPIVEAQACGTPVIVGNWTAMSELCGAGWTIGKHEAHEVWTPQEASQWVPSPGAVTEALELAYHAKGGRLAMRLATRAREFAMAYDADHVAETYWRPTLDAIAARLGVDKPEALGTVSEFIAPAPVNRWAKTGLYIDANGTMALPSLLPNDDRALIVARDGTKRIEHGWDHTVDGISLDIEDDPDGAVSKIVAREITQSYRLHELPLTPESVVIDLGAHVGVVACYLAKRYGCRVISYEAHPVNFALLGRNVQANSVTHLVSRFNIAATGDGRSIQMPATVGQNSGGNSIYGSDGVTVQSFTLATIASGLEHIDLLKVDIEGAEYEVLTAPGAEDVLLRVDCVAIEVHERPGYDGRTLIEYLLNRVPLVIVNGQRLQGKRRKEVTA